MAKRSLFLAVLLAFYCISNLNSQTQDEFKKRRLSVIEKLEPGSVMIIKTPDASGMFDYGRRGGNFYYLTGIEEPGCTLILLSKDVRILQKPLSAEKEILFIRPINSDRADWDQLTIGLEGARSKYGFKDSRPDYEANEFIARLLTQNLSTLYMDFKKSTSINNPLTDDEQLIARAKEHGASFAIQNPGKIINPMASKKSQDEIDLMRNVVSITAEAQKEAMRSMAPGLYEYQLNAIIMYVFSINGSGSVSFPTIIGSGINSVVLHWMENSRKMEDGDIVVIDCGAENQMYCADITRTIPVSGKYSERQKAIYEIVLKANEEAIKAIGPGVKFQTVSSKADTVLADGMVRIGLIKNKSEFKKYYYHSLSHNIGLKGISGNSLEILEPGMIITIEPGIYVREEKIGVRIEDDVLVTENGYEVLSKNAPKQITEIEKLMKEDGMNIQKNIIK